MRTWLQRKVCLATLMLAGATPAAELWDNGATDGSNGIAHFPSPAFQSVMDDFVVPQGKSWCIDGFSTVGVWDTLPPGQLDCVELVIWSDNNGQPGAMIHELNVTNQFEQITGLNWFGREEVEISAVNEPYCLDEGTYWIEMHVNGPESFFQMARLQLTNSSIWLRNPNNPAWPAPFWGRDVFGVEYNVSFKIEGQVQAVWNSGMEHLALGQAKLDLDTNGHLVVSNIGSSGQDGVRVELGEADGYGFMLSDIAEPLGAFREITAIGTIDGVPDQRLFTRRYEVTQAQTRKNPGVLRVSQDSGVGATLYNVKAYDASGNLLHGTTLPASNWLWEVPTFPSHSLCVIVNWRPDGPQDVPTCQDEGAYAGAITFGDNVRVSDVFRIEIQAVDPTGELEFFSRVEDVATGIPEFTLMDSTLGKFGNMHLALGGARFETTHPPVDHDALVISNIGSSGDDGVRLEVDRSAQTDLAYVEMEPIAFDSPGKKIRLGGRGTYDTLGEVDLGEAGLEVDPTGGVEVFADFSSVGSSLVRIEVYDNGALVGFTVVPGGGTVARVQGGPTSLLCAGSNGEFWFTNLVPTTYVAIDSSQFTGDEVHLIPESTTFEFERLGTFDITGAILSACEFTILSETFAISAETICPDDPNDFQRFAGGLPIGDASLLCDSDDNRLRTPNLLPFAPVLPFIRIETWSHTTAAPLDVSLLIYTVEGGVTALVPGGQNPDTMRTSIRNYNAGAFEVVDVRATASAFVDEVVSYTQAANASDYVQAGDGEVRVRVDAFNPGGVLNASWELRLDTYSVTVIQ